MKKLTLLFVVCLAACTNPTDEPSDFQIKTASEFTSPSFQDPDRIDKFKSTFSKVDSLFTQHASENHYPGFAYGILVDGQLIHSGGTGVIHLDSKIPVDNTSAFHIASMTKSFTSMGIMILRDEGKLSLNDPAHNYIPELKNITYPTLDSTPITIKNLMTMSSGFPEDNPWADRQLEETDEAFLEMIATGLPFSNLPSTQYEYSNLGYTMLGTIINNVTGTTYQSFLTDRVLLPLGMNHTYWEYSEVPEDKLAVGYRWEEEQWKPEPLLHTGAFGSIGGLITTMDDFSKYVTYLMSATPPGNTAENGPLKRSSLREMQQPTFPRLSANARKANGSTCPTLSGYAYGLGYTQDCEGIIRVSHSGGLPGYGSEYRMYPDYGFAIISFSNRTYSGTGSANSKVADLIFETGIEARKIAASSILVKRQKEVVDFLETWEDSGIFAENFFLDQSLELRKKDFSPSAAEIGSFISVEPIDPRNQLRGVFRIIGEKKDLMVAFSLSPETDPKVQALYYQMVDK